MGNLKYLETMKKIDLDQLSFETTSASSAAYSRPSSMRNMTKASFSEIKMKSKPLMKEEPLKKTNTELTYSSASQRIKQEPVIVIDVDNDMQDKKEKEYWDLQEKQRAYLKLPVITAADGPPLRSFSSEQKRRTNRRVIR